MASNRTYMATRDKVAREWYVVDATDNPLGRLAVKIARILMGKHKATYTPHVDCGDFVIVINADKVKLTGNKLMNAKRYHHTGYPGGIKSQTYGEIMAKRPERLVELVVKGMLPSKTRLNFQRKLKVYAGANHPHEAQQPVTLDI